MHLYHTSTLRFKTPIGGRALFIDETGESIVLVRCPEGVKEELRLPTCEFECHPVPADGEGDRVDLEQRCRDLIKASVDAARRLRLLALFTQFTEMFEGQVTIIQYTGSRTEGEWSPTEGLKAVHEFGLAALSWFPEELAECRPVRLT